MESLTEGHICAMSLFSLSLPKASMGTASKGDAERWNSFLTQAELFVLGNFCFLLFITLSVFFFFFFDYVSNSFNKRREHF